MRLSTSSLSVAVLVSILQTAIVPSAFADCTIQTNATAIDRTTATSRFGLENAARSGNKLYVIGTDLINVIDTNTDSIRSTIAIPSPITQSLVGNKLYVLSRDGSITVVDTTKDTVTKKISGLTIDFSAEFYVFGTVLAAVNYDGTAAFIDTNQDAVISQVQTGTKWEYLNLVGDDLFIGANAGQAIAVLDVKKGTMLPPITVSQSSDDHDTIDSVLLLGTNLYVGTMTHLSVIDTTTRTITHTIEQPVFRIFTANGQVFFTQMDVNFNMSVDEINTQTFKASPLQINGLSGAADAGALGNIIFISTADGKGVIAYDPATKKTATLSSAYGVTTVRLGSYDITQVSTDSRGGGALYIQNINGGPLVTSVQSDTGRFSSALTNGKQDVYLGSSYGSPVLYDRQSKTLKDLSDLNSWIDSTIVIGSKLYYTVAAGIDSNEDIAGDIFVYDLTSGSPAASCGAKATAPAPAKSVVPLKTIKRTTPLQVKKPAVILSRPSRRSLRSKAASQ